MHRTIASMLALGLIALMPLATAQDTPCTASAPCPIAIDVDADSLTIADGDEYRVTAGDVFQFDVFNTDDADHEIVIADLGISMMAPGLGSTGPSSEHGPYALDAPGSYEVLDVTSGATATLVVLSSDVAQADEPSGEADSKGMPGLGVAVLMASMVAIALRRQ
jgi:hypothetical protein